MRISLSQLAKKGKPKKRTRLSGEPRPFKPKAEPKHSVPIREPQRLGPDAIHQRNKEKSLRDILDQANIHNEQLFKQLLRWEQS